MKILALDTSTDACSIALINGDKLSICHQVIPKQHALSLLTLINQTLNIDLSTLTALAWGCGPGSFTGLRIAASAIQALSFAYDLPIVNISSLAAMAQTAYQERGWKRLLVAVDARMQEVYWGQYQINEQGYAELIGEEVVSKASEVPVNLPTVAAGEACYGLGNGWVSYQKELNNRIQYDLKAIDITSMPKALAIAQLGRLKYERGECLQAAEALPVYLRNKVVG